MTRRKKKGKHINGFKKTKENNEKVDEFKKNRKGKTKKL